MLGKLTIGTVAIVGFFLVLFYGLFLGEGYQTIIEPYLAGSVVILFLATRVYNKQVRKLDTSVQRTWAVVLVVYTLLIFTSRSIGFSITEVVRISIGYLVFLLFYSFSSPRLQTLFFKSLMIFVCVAASISLLLLVFPKLGQTLPPTNLLFAYYGHNHLATLLLFVLPGTVEFFIHKKNWQRLVLCLFILFSLILTFSRGAYLIIGVYFLIRFWKVGWSKSTNTQAVLVLAITTFAIAIFGMMTSGIKLPELPIHLQPQLSKASPLENRISYWSQALKSFVSHPILGSGPGTFYLESLKFQSKPNTFSYYAHSYPLQMLSEIGTIGFVALFCLYALLGKRLRVIIKSSKTSLEVKSMIWGTGVVFAYSLIDFNFNFLVVWVLFWATKGIVYEPSQKRFESNETQIDRLILWGGVSMLLIYFSTTFTSLLQGQNKVRALYISPFNTDRTLDMLDEINVKSEAMSVVTANLIHIFHRDEPDIMRKMIDYYQRGEDIENTGKVFSILLSIDPKNISNHKMYLSWVAEKLDEDEIKNSFIKSADIFLPTGFESQIHELSMLESNVLAPYLVTITEQLKNEPAELYHMKLFYLMGLSIIDDDPIATKKFWTLARDIYPLAGLLYHELAALSLTQFADANAAARYIQECMSVPHAALHCVQIHENFDNLPPPGFVKDDILLLSN